MSPTLFLGRRVGTGKEFSLYRYVVQVGFKFMIFLPQVPKSWDYKVCTTSLDFFTPILKEVLLLVKYCQTASQAIEKSFMKERVNR
jgi:hypothetical protein